MNKPIYTQHRIFHALPKTLASLGLVVFFSLILIWICSEPLWAQALESRISNLISNLIRILNLILVGAIAWAGFLMARGDASGLQRLMYAIIGIVVVNSAELIINYFT